MSDEALDLTPAWWDELIAVNIGSGVLPPYKQVPGKSERWFFPKVDDTGAVCIQIALAKLKLLVDAGCPTGALRLMLCTVTDGKGQADMYYGGTGISYKVDAMKALTDGWCNHAVLGVEVIDDGKQGVLILDNRKAGMPIGPDSDFYATYLWMEEERGGVWRDMRADNPQAKGLTLTPYPAAS